MATTPRNSRQPGAVKLGGGDARKGGVGWLKWLLPLLALLVLAILLIMLLGGDDTSTASKTAASPGTLTSGGQTLRGQTPDTLTAAVGQRATGSAVKVLSVASGTGFWVGTSDSDRTFVEYGSSVGGDESQPYKPKVGDTVDLRGPVRPAPDDPAQTLKLNARDAARLSAQGAYINADEVTAR